MQLATTITPTTPIGASTPSPVGERSAAAPTSPLLPAPRRDEPAVPPIAFEFDILEEQEFPGPTLLDLHNHVRIDLRDVAGAAPTLVRTQLTAKDGTIMAVTKRDLAVTPEERAAATGLAQAFAGSKLVRTATPFVDGPLTLGTIRLVYTTADGERRMRIDDVTAPDDPTDAPISDALSRYLTVSGAFDELGALTGRGLLARGAASATRSR